MAEQFSELPAELVDWIPQQHLFFVATAAAEGRINLSPKGMDSLRVLNPKELLWLNLTGSGNETAAHVHAVNRMTLMWCAFDGRPNIVRIYGRAEVYHPRDREWSECAELLPPPLGARQYFRVAIDTVQTSCGYAVPLMEFVEDRRVLDMWAEKRGQAGVEAYWAEKNQRSIDGLPTRIID